MVAYAQNQESDSLRFALGVLEEVKSSASVLALAELVADVVDKLPERLANAVTLASAINLSLSFKNSPTVYPHTAARLRKFLHSLLTQCLDEPQRATVVCALRGVSDDESIQIIKKLPDFCGSYIGLELSVCKAIYRRLRDA